MNTERYEMNLEVKNAEDFERNVPYICELTFSYGTFFRRIFEHNIP